MRRFVVICAVVVLFSVGSSMAGTWTTYDAPGSPFVTKINGINGNNLVGYYSTSSGYSGFVYDGTTWSSVDKPEAHSTYVTGMSGSKLVGVYDDSFGTHGFLNNGGTWTTLPIIPSAIDGSNVVGGNQIYNLTTESLSTLNVPGAISGISGSTLVGQYTDTSNKTHGFLYNGTTWTTLDAPDGVRGTYARGISGGSIVGWYQDTSWRIHGFLYDGTTWTTLDAPESGGWTWINAIEGNKLAGAYEDAAGNDHGFVYEIPEPATLLLLGLGGLILRKR